MDAELWSSIEFFEYAEELCAALANEGVSTKQRFLVSKHDYRIATGRLGRAWLRARMYGGYPLMLAADFLFQSHRSVSIVTTNTFYAPWIAVRLAHGARHVVNLVYDLFPEALVASGVLAPHAAVTRAIRLVTKDTFHRAAANVFLGRHLLEHACNQYGDIPRAEIIPVGAAAAPFLGSRPVGRDERLPIVIAYCGNLGRMHDTRTIIEACKSAQISARQTSTTPLAVRFHASGPRLAELRTGLGIQDDRQRIQCDDLLTVELSERVSDKDWRATMLATDIGLVTMAPGAENVVMPSKTYTAMVAGQAILAICPLRSDLADLVQQHDCGWVVVPECDESAAHGSTHAGPNVFYGSRGLREVLSQIASDRMAVIRKRQNAFDAGHRYFSSTAVARQWKSLLDSVMSRKRASS